MQNDNMYRVALQKHSIHRREPRTIESHNKLHATNQLEHNLILATTATLNPTGGTLILISLHFLTAELSPSSLTHTKGNSIHIKLVLPIRQVARKT